MAHNKIVELLGADAESLLNHQCKTIEASSLHAPSPNHVDEVWAGSNRNIQTLRSIQNLLGHGRLADTGYVSILPVDQGIEHSAGASFAPTALFLLLKPAFCCFCRPVLVLRATPNRGQEQTYFFER